MMRRVTVDVDALRPRCSVPDLLDALGYGTPRRWRRMPCPIHQGRNPSAFEISPDGQRWRCYGVCGAGGDVFDLAMRLNGSTFLDAVKIVAKLGGFATLPTLGDVESERARTIARRRRNLRAWRDARLNELTVDLHDLDRDADWLHQVAVGAHVRGGQALVEYWLDLLEQVYVATDSADWFRWCAADDRAGQCDRRASTSAACCAA